MGVSKEKVKVQYCRFIKDRVHHWDLVCPNFFEAKWEISWFSHRAAV